jgi:23S rRNA (guanine745-N1)-methyltransferase
MNSDLSAYLRCPVCDGPLAAAAGHPPPALRCPRGHSFDLARQGYVHLAAGRVPHAGDSAAMIAAREEFLSAGHYDFISAALAEAAGQAAGGPGGPRHAEAAGPGGPRHVVDAGQAGGPGGPRHVVDAGQAGGPGGPRLVVDAGAGTGRHLAAVLDALPTAVGLALDVSKPALRRAARAHPRAGAALCDTWGRLPLGDAGTTVLLNVFAPRNGPEFSRVLRPDGVLLVVTPEPDHLTELVEALRLLRVDPEKPARVAGSLGPEFAPAGEAVHRRVLRLTRPHLVALVGMGPSAWHTDPALADRLAALPEPTTVTAAVRLRRYHPRLDR